MPCNCDKILLDLAQINTLLTTKLGQLEGRIASLENQIQGKVGEDRARSIAVSAASEVEGRLSPPIQQARQEAQVVLGMVGDMGGRMTGLEVALAALTATVAALGLLMDQLRQALGELRDLAGAALNAAREAIAKAIESAQALGGRINDALTRIAGYDQAISLLRAVDDRIISTVESVNGKADRARDEAIVAQAHAELAQANAEYALEKNELALKEAYLAGVEAEKGRREAAAAFDLGQKVEQDLKEEIRQREAIAARLIQLAREMEGFPSLVDRNVAEERRRAIADAERIAQELTELANELERFNAARDRDIKTETQRARQAEEALARDYATVASASSTALSQAEQAKIDAAWARIQAQQAEGSSAQAQSTANTAQQTAAQAQSTANTAQQTAAQAQSTANTAQQTAAQAQSTANTAQQTAAQAQSTANTAQQTAAQAKNIAEAGSIREVVTREERIEVPINMESFTGAIDRATNAANEAKAEASAARVDLAGLNTAINATKLAVDAVGISAGNANVNATSAANAANAAKDLAGQASTKAAELQRKMDEQWEKIKSAIGWGDLIAALNLMVSLHNAAMLSRNLLDTLAQVVSNGLAILGVKDADGSPIDFAQVIGRSANDLMSAILGADVWANTKQTWNAASRVYQSASQIVWTVASITDSIRTVAEYTGENVSHIGNALRNDGVVSEGAYRYMSPDASRFSSAQRRIDTIMEGLDRADSVAGSLATVTSEIRSGQEEITQLFEDRQQFQQSLETFKTEADELALSVEAASTNPDIEKADWAEGVTP